MTENEATREMTFEEEYQILQKEKEELFAMENCDSEPPFANSVVRRASRCIRKLLEEIQQYRAIGTVEELQKSIKEEDVLKFYYIESEDKYVVGQRVDNFYYGEVGKTGLAFYMSRYLPWGEHVVAPETLWKEHTYPSEPKEIPFFDWLQGFMKKEYGGTIEEFKALKEKNEPKKPILNNPKINEFYIKEAKLCPACHSYINNCSGDYCRDCGQKLDWSE